MPANLPPQFYNLWSELKDAKDTEEKISILERLLAVTPKHKGTEKVQKDIKRKIARLKREEKKSKKGRAENPYYIKKEGAGQIVITGLSNSGKTTLINNLTGAKAKTGSYPFTTELPKPAMMPYEDISIQLIDTPPLILSSPLLQLKEVFQGADGLLLVFDLSKANIEAEVMGFNQLLKNWRFNQKKILVGNKIDLKTSQRNFEKIKSKFNIKAVSALKKIGLEELKKDIFDLLDIVRVYTKTSQKSLPDFSHPYVTKKNTRLIELAREIHHDLAFSFKYAKLFKLGLKHHLIVGKDYILQDKDIIEIEA